MIDGRNHDQPLPSLLCYRSLDQPLPLTHKLQVCIQRHFRSPFYS